MNSLLEQLVEERGARLKGGLYHKTQVNLAYNSNRIEGSRLTEEQTRYIFETRTVGFGDEEAVRVDDIIETSNHFVAFDVMLDTIGERLSNETLKQFHRILKSGTADAQREWFAVGDWKRLANEVGGTETTPPKQVESAVTELNEWYNGLAERTFEAIVEYHWRLECIHPFQDGNGRVGRLVMFRECLREGVIPFITDEQHKQFYYRGLREFAALPGYLLDTCRSAQDTYETWIEYFREETVKE